MQCHRRNPSKNFDLREGAKRQLIVQAYNTFKHVNVGNPNSYVDC